MENTIKHYNDYISKAEKTWRSRFTWKSLSGKDPKHSISIMNFNAATDALKNVKRVNTSTELFSLVNDLSDKYVAWIKTMDKKFTAQEYFDLKNFFIGAIGEFFVYHLLTDVKCLMVSEDGNMKFNRFDFNYVSPTLSAEPDNGIDMYCVANDVPCVMQIKFWSPFKKTKIEPEIYQKMICEGVLHKYIDVEQENNTILFWLGGEHAAIQSVNKDKEKLKHIVVIGRQTLECSIDGRNQIFWDNFYNSLANI